jgi:hypothetical protein
MSGRRTLLGLAAGAFAVRSAYAQTAAERPASTPSRVDTQRPMTSGSPFTPFKKDRLVSLPQVPLFEGTATLPSGPDTFAPAVRTRQWDELLAQHASLFPNLLEYAARADVPGATVAVLPSANLRGAFRYEGRAEDQKFNSFNVEALIDQSADLLDRVLRDRSELEERLARAATLSLDIADYVEADKIHQAEIAAGLYALAHQITRSELKAQEATERGAGTNYRLVNWNISEYFSLNAMNEQSRHSQTLAWIGHVPNFEYPYVGNNLTLTIDGDGRTAGQHAIHSTFVQSFWYLENQRGSLRMQSNAFATDQTVSKHRQAGLQVKATYEQKDVLFRKRRNELARRLADLKVQWTIELDGPLNFAEKAARIRRRIDRDLRDALSRLRSVHEGLTLLYGYRLALPASVKTALSGGDANASAVIDDATQWVRDAIGWLVRFAEYDEAYVYSINVKERLSTTAWASGLRSGLFEVELDESDFPNQRHVRVRGVSIYVEGDSLWSARIEAPSASYSVHQDGSKHSLDQGAQGHCRVGRVTRRDAVREPDIAGVSLLRNTSPYGVWRISLSQTSRRENLLEVNDLSLDIHLAVQTLRSAVQ